MKLSEAFLTERVRFERREDGVFKRFEACVRKSFPDADADTFPLAFCCPLFRGSVDTPKCVFELIPAGVLPEPAGIYFLCDVIDFLTYKLRWDEKRVGELVKQIEETMESHGLDDYGRKPVATDASSR